MRGDDNHQTVAEIHLVRARWWQDPGEHRGDY